MRAYDTNGNLLINTNEITFRVFDVRHNPIASIFFEDEDYFVEHVSSGLNKCLSFYEMGALAEVVFSDYILTETKVFQIYGCPWGFNTHLDLRAFKSLEEVSIYGSLINKITLSKGLKRLDLKYCNITDLILSNQDHLEKLTVEGVPLKSISPLRNVKNATFIKTNLKKIEVQTQMESLTCEGTISLNQDKVRLVKIVE